MSETLLDTQELQYPSDFSTASSSSVLDDSENLQKEISTLESLYEAPLDMQELEYSESEMPSCSTDDRSESSSNESINLDFSKLKPYDLEPVCKPRIFSSESELEIEVEEQGRIGNTDWCQCGECKAMITYTESLCCQDTNEVPEELFEGQKCITRSSGFRMVCLEKPVLHASLSALNHLRGDSMENLDKSSYRFAGYKQYTFWVHNYLGKGVRKVIPSCAVWKIRNEYKADNDVYVPFMESKEDEERRLNTDD